MAKCAGLKFTHSIKHIEDDIQWNIYNLESIIEKIRPMPKTATFIFGGIEWFMSLSSRTKSEFGVFIEAVANQWDPIRRVQVKFEITILCEGEVLENVIPHKVMLTKESPGIWTCIQKHRNAYNQKLLDLNSTEDETPLTIVCKLNFSVETTSHKTDAESCATKHLKSPEFQLREFNDYKKLFSPKFGKRFSDFTIVCENVEIPVHKAVLAARSEYFSKIFNSQCKEMEDSNMIIKNVKINVMMEVLSFIYCVEVQNIEVMAEELLRVADMYQIVGLKDICEKYLCQSINEENLADLIRIADSYNASILKDKTNEIIANRVLKGLRNLTGSDLTAEQKFLLAQLKI